MMSFHIEQQLADMLSEATGIPIYAGSPRWWREPRCPICNARLNMIESMDMEPPIRTYIFQCGGMQEEATGNVISHPDIPIPMARG